MDDEQQAAGPGDGHAWLISGAFMLLFLLLLIGVALFATILAEPGFAGLSWGQILFVALNVLPVIAAWLHIHGGRGL